MEDVHSMFNSMLWSGGIGILFLVIGSFIDTNIKLWFPIMAIGSGLFGYALFPIVEMGIFEVLSMFGIPLLFLKFLYWFVAIAIMPFFFKFASPKRSRRRY